MAMGMGSISSRASAGGTIRAPVSTSPASPGGAPVTRRRVVTITWRWEDVAVRCGMARPADEVETMRVRRAMCMAATLVTVATTIATVGSTARTASAAGSVPLSTGLGADGQLGSGSTATRTSAGPIAGPLATAGDVVQIASGREHAYALDSTGRVWAWGDNSKSAVGDGTSVDRSTPVRLSLTEVVEVEAGHYHGIALRRDGTVWTWGYGTIGQLGLGTTVNRNVPTQVPGLSGIVSVAAGRDMSYALAADRTMWGWGNNTFGEVGDGTTTRRVSPVPVQGIDQVVEIAGGRNHVLARRADGSVWAWGANDHGQLGDGSLVSTSVPEQILAGPAAHVDTGAEHSLVVMEDGTVRSWGRGQRGQLGLGTTNTRTTPQPVPGLSGIVEIGDGRDQSFAMDAAGSVWAWGMNDTGQLGDGTTTTRLSPVPIPSLSGIVAAQGGRGMTIFLPAPGATDPDVNPPSAPGTPVGTSTVAGRVDLTWAAATDDRATTLTYRVFIDDGTTPVGTIPGSTSGTVSFSQTGLAGGSVHTWHVVASDGTNTGPSSAPSEAVTVASRGRRTDRPAGGRLHRRVDRLDIRQRAQRRHDDGFAG